MPQKVKSNINRSFQAEPSHTMEIAGMAIGLVSLVSVFENAITCFTRVRMAKTFGSDLQLFMLRLEVLHLRLTRWGEAVGLNKPIKDIRAPSAEAQALANKLLKQITTHFEDAVKVVEGLDIGEDVAASTADLGDKKTLIERMHAMSIKRHPRPSITTKAKWVIYQKDKLSGLVEELSASVDQLAKVLPADADTLTRICDDEASHLLDNRGIQQASVSMLEDVTAKLDGKLADAIARHKSKVSTSYRRSSS